MRGECQSAFPIDDKGGRQGINSAVQLAYRIIAQQNTVIHLMRGNVRLDCLPSVFVHRNAKDLKALALELLFELDEPRNLEAAWTAPGRPEIHDHHLTAQVAELDGVPVAIL